MRGEWKHWVKDWIPPHLRRLLPSPGHDEAVRYSIRRIMQGEGFAVEVAANGREGIELLDSAFPALVITDLIMPLILFFGPPLLNVNYICRHIASRQNLTFEHLVASPMILLTHASTVEPAGAIRNGGRMVVPARTSSCSHWSLKVTMVRIRHSFTRRCNVRKRLVGYAPG